MWIKTKAGSYFNLDRADGLVLEKGKDNEFALCAMMYGKGFAIGRYPSVKQTQKVMDDIMDEFVEGCELYEMD